MSSWEIKIPDPWEKPTPVWKKMVKTQNAKCTEGNKTKGGNECRNTGRILVLKYGLTQYNLEFNREFFDRENLPLLGGAKQLRFWEPFSAIKGLYLLEAAGSGHWRGGVSMAITHRQGSLGTHRGGQCSESPGRDSLRRGWELWGSDIWKTMAKKRRNVLIVSICTVQSREPPR